MTHAGDFLVVLVAFAGHENHVARVRTCDRGTYGLRAIGRDGARRREAFEYVGDDPVRVFGARVIAGDDHLVREPARDASHERTFAPVAIAAAAEDADELAAALAAPRAIAFRGGHESAKRPQHVLERIRRMRVVDDVQGLTPAAITLGAAGNG